jgi:hypothetical protein
MYTKSLAFVYKNRHNAYVLKQKVETQTNIKGKYDASSEKGRSHTAVRK